jgi:GNAT superfamily N-acetyltransferase
MAGRVTFAALTPERWDDLTALFGARGACGGCWCMFFRLRGKAFTEGAKGGGAANRRALRRIVEQGPPPGLIAYVGREPAAWCALAPRQDYERIVHSRILAPVDERPVWSVPCFFVGRPFRRQGLTVKLLAEAARFAAAHGATLLEGYPVDPRKGAMPDVFAYHGTLAAFERAGFREVARRSATRPIVRKPLRAPRGAKEPRG